MYQITKKVSILIFLVTALCHTSLNSAYAEGGFISGKVTGSDGKTPIAGIEIRAIGKGSDGKAHVGTAKSQINGEYVIENLLSGTYTLWTSSPDYVESEKANISVSDNKVTPDINFILFKRATVSGKVTELDGVTPITGADVFLNGSDKLPKNIATTDQEGKYVVDEILPDTYWIRAQKDGYTRYITYPTPIEEGQKITDLNFRIEKSATISGIIMTENTTHVVEKAAIFAGPEERVYAFGASDLNGNFLLEGLPSGICKIVILAKDHQPFSYELDIPPGGNTVNQNFYLKLIN